MAKKILLDNREIDENLLLGFDSIVIDNSISENYYSFLNSDGFAFSENNVSVTIKDSDLVDYIKEKFSVYGLEAQIFITIIDGSNKFNLLIDFETYKEIDCCYLEFTLKPFGNQRLLLDRENLEFSVPLVETITVPLRDVPDDVTFDVLEYDYQGVGDLSHTIPLKVKSQSDGSNLVLQNTSTSPSLPFLKTNIDNCINLVGSVKVLALSDTVTSFNVVLVYGQNRTVIDTFNLSSVQSEQTISISEQVNLVAQDSVFLLIEGIGNSDYRFIYQSNSEGLSISNCTQNAVETRKIKAVSMRDAFANLINKCTNGLLSLDYYLFDDSPIDLYLTNNEGLQNKSSFINVKFSDLFEELGHKYPVSLDIKNNKVSIIHRYSNIEDMGYKIHDFVSITRRVNSDVIYSDIKAGYNNWKGDLLLSGLEHNGSRNYNSNLSFSNRQLSLLGDWSASSQIITEQIIKERKKEEVHFISVIKSSKRAETNEYIASDIYDSASAINMRISPGRNFARNMKFINNDFNFTSGSGNYNYNSTDSLNLFYEVQGVVDENGFFNGNNYFDLFLYEIIVDSCNIDLDYIKQILTFDYCGVAVKGQVKSFKFKTNSLGSSLVELLVVEVRQ